MLKLPDFSSDLFGLVVGADGTIVHCRISGKGPGKVCLCHSDIHYGNITLKTLQKRCLIIAKKLLHSQNHLFTLLLTFSVHVKKSDGFLSSEKLRARRKNSEEL